MRSIKGNVRVSYEWPSPLQPPWRPLRERFSCRKKIYFLRSLQHSVLSYTQCLCNMHSLQSHLIRSILFRNSFRRVILVPLKKRTERLSSLTRQLPLAKLKPIAGRNFASREPRLGNSILRESRFLKTWLSRRLFRSGTMNVKSVYMLRRCDGRANVQQEASL